MGPEQALHAVGLGEVGEKLAKTEEKGRTTWVGLDDLKGLFQHRNSVIL